MQRLGRMCIKLKEDRNSEDRVNAPSLDGPGFYLVLINVSRKAVSSEHFNTCDASTVVDPF